jgi:hypothetical protein
VWVQTDEVIYHNRVFDRFRGLLTYGSPLAKFAGIWPGIVQVSTEVTFQNDPVWINLYDPRDPVSGRLGRLLPGPLRFFPIDLGYAAGPWLLLTHLQYLKQRADRVDAAEATLHWMLTDCTGAFPSPLPSLSGCAVTARGVYGRHIGEWFQYRDGVWWARTAVAYFQWAAAAIILAFVGAVILPTLAGFISEASAALWAQLGKFTPFGLQDPPKATFPVVTSIGSAIDAVNHAFAWTCYKFLNRMLALTGWAVIITVLVGAVYRLFIFKRDPDDR